MDILGNVINIITNPQGAIAGLATGFVVYHVYQALKAIFKPVEYVSKLYAIADKLIENIDDRYIDKFLPADIKKDIQKDLANELSLRKLKIDNLIKKIND